MRFAAIADWADSGDFDVAMMCSWLGVSRAGYYKWRNTRPSTRAVLDAHLSAIIAAVHAAGRGNPGVRRVWAELRARGYRVAKKRVWKLMKAAGLRGRHPKAWKKTTLAAARPVGAPDLIGRDFTAGAPNQKWCGDITYVKTWTGWAYVATVIDLYSRRIIGHAVADHMRTDLVTDALTMALTRRPAPGVIFHSDRGSQYTSATFAAFCAANNIRRSLGRTGICYDNAVAESVFATYKKELIHTRPWPNIAALRTATVEWIEAYYNTTRRHSYLGYLTPREIELGYTHINHIAD